MCTAQMLNLPHSITNNIYVCSMYMHAYSSWLVSLLHVTIFMEVQCTMSYMLFIVYGCCLSVSVPVYRVWPFSLLMFILSMLVHNIMLTVHGQQLSKVEPQGGAKCI